MWVRCQVGAATAHNSSAATLVGRTSPSVVQAKHIFLCLAASRLLGTEQHERTQKHEWRTIIMCHGTSHELTGLQQIYCATLMYLATYIHNIHSRALHVGDKLITVITCSNNFTITLIFQFWITTITWWLKLYSTSVTFITSQPGNVPPEYH